MDFPNGTKYGAEIAVGPIIALTGKQFVPKTWKVVSDMTVSAHMADNLKSDTKIGLKAGGSIGWGPFKLDAELTGDTSVNVDKQRTSDQRAVIHGEMEMGLIDAPEGIMRLTDAVTKLIDYGVKLAEPSNPPPTPVNPPDNSPFTPLGPSGGGNDNVTQIDEGDSTIIVINNSERKAA